jgi:hypothetical protein
LLEVWSLVWSSRAASEDSVIQDGQAVMGTVVVRVPRLVLAWLSVGPGFLFHLRGLYSEASSAQRKARCCGARPIPL